MRILVTGSRSWTDPAPIMQVLQILADAVPDEPVIVVHGAAGGADTIASQWAAIGGRIRQERYPANWARHGRRAGIVRNLEMVKRGADVCLAFIRDDSVGATHCARTAEAAGIETRIFRWPAVSS